MTVYRSLSPQQRPAWSDVTGAGTFSVGRDGRFDRHHHECHEYWMIYAGSALISVDDREYAVSAGDIVCIEKDTDHDVLEVYEPLEGSGWRVLLHRADARAICIGRQSKLEATACPAGTRLHPASYRAGRRHNPHASVHPDWDGGLGPVLVRSSPTQAGGRRQDRARCCRGCRPKPA